MPDQANMLVDRMINKLGKATFDSEWKLVTFFIGGNDLCDYCKDTVYTFCFDNIFIKLNFFFYIGYL